MEWNIQSSGTRCLGHFFFSNSSFPCPVFLWEVGCGRSFCHKFCLLSDYTLRILMRASSWWRRAAASSLYVSWRHSRWTVRLCSSPSASAYMPASLIVSLSVSQCSMLKFRWELADFFVSNSTAPHTQRVELIVVDRGWPVTSLQTEHSTLAQAPPYGEEKYVCWLLWWRRAWRCGVCLLTWLKLAESLSSHTQSKCSTNSLMVELFLTAAVRVIRSVAVTWFRTTVSGNFSWSANESTSPPQASCAQKKHTRRRSCGMWESRRWGSCSHWVEVREEDKMVFLLQETGQELEHHMRVSVFARMIVKRLLQKAWSSPHAQKRVPPRPPCGGSHTPSSEFFSARKKAARNSWKVRCWKEYCLTSVRLSPAE